MTTPDSHSFYCETCGHCLGCNPHLGESFQPAIHDRKPACDDCPWCRKWD